MVKQVGISAPLECMACILLILELRCTSLKNYTRFFFILFFLIKMEKGVREKISLPLCLPIKKRPIRPASPSVCGAQKSRILRINRTWIPTSSPQSSSPSSSPSKEGVLKGRTAPLSLSEMVAHYKKLNRAAYQHPGLYHSSCNDVDSYVTMPMDDPW
jgi:hypothetical protein